MKAIDWNHIRAFHATATAGSLSAGARQLGLTQPTLSRQVLALEADLGVALFERLGRKLVLTQTGVDLLHHIRIMGDAADSVALAASGRVQEISGRVCISATDTFSAYVLPEISNLHRREADIAIRHVRPDRSGLVGQHIRDTEACFYAAEDWVARNGLPKGPAEVSLQLLPQSYC
jgi:DNA-binding transcriptional LysR family regulator